MNNQKGLSTIVVIFITVVITTVIIGVGIFVWQNYGQQKNNLPKTTSPSLSPSTVVSNYMKSTLGTIPGADLNETAAKSYLASSLKAQYTDPSFIPTTYGIQQGPDAVAIASEDITNNTAVVVVNAAYGATWSPMWKFQLVIEENVWKISNITNIQPRP